MLLVYVLVLVTSAVLLTVAAVRGTGQRVGARVLNGVFAALFLGYAGYLAVFFTGGEVVISFWALLLPVIAVVRMARARRATRSAGPENYPDIYAQPPHWPTLSPEAPPTADQAGHKPAEFWTQPRVAGPPWGQPPTPAPPAAPQGPSPAPAEPGGPAPSGLPFHLDPTRPAAHPDAPAPANLPPSEPGRHRH